MKYFCSLFFFFILLQANSQNIYPKKIIAFGWDYPTVSYLLKNIEKINNTPFDGVCFSINKDIIQLFDTGLKRNEYFLFPELSKIKWSAQTANFLKVRGYGSNGPHWFNNTHWRNILKNAESVSKAVLLSNAKGILFDAEYYLEDPELDPWTFSKKRYPNHSFQQVKKQVFLRGLQIAKALTTHKKQLEVLSIWTIGLAYHQQKKQDVEKIGHALLPSFIAGLLACEGIQLIDGNETAYWYENAIDFLKSARILKTKAAPVFFDCNNVKVFASKTQFAQPVYYDGLLAKDKLYDRGLDSITKVAWMKNNLETALAVSDKYVWFYTERGNWWEGNIDESVKKLLYHVKNVAKDRFENPGKTFFRTCELNIASSKELNDYCRFIPSKNELHFSFKEVVPTFVYIYQNSALNKIVKPNKKMFFIRMNNSNMNTNITVLTSCNHTILPNHQSFALVR